MFKHEDPKDMSRTQIVFVKSDRYDTGKFIQEHGSLKELGRSVFELTRGDSVRSPDNRFQEKWAEVVRDDLQGAEAYRIRVAWEERRNQNFPDAVLVLEVAQLVMLHPLDPDEVVSVAVSTRRQLEQEPLSADTLSSSFLGSMRFANSVIGMSSASVAGERDHNGGFFLRLAPGIAFAEANNDGLSLEFSGSGVELDLAIGGMIAENLALHGTIFGWLITDDNVDLGGVTGTADIDMTAVGAGLTYYFMPVNIYLSGSIGMGQLTGSGDVTGESDSGPAAMVSVGKEWWVSGRWGLGLAGVLGFVSLPESDATDNWKGWNLALMFSATFN